MAKVILAMIVFLSPLLLGCASVTKRMNGRAESHVKFHAAKELDCSEESLTLKCSSEYRSGECYEYEVIGCNKGIVYKNVTSSGWTS